MRPLVSIIIPCRNEEKFISACLDSIIVNDFPKEKLEILVIDGMSEDGTGEIVKEYSEKYPFIKLLENPKKITSPALNIGIKRAKGGIIVRMDAHATYPKDYIPNCVKYLDQSGADNVGGLMIAVSRNDTILGGAIAAVLSHPFGVGNAVFRTGTKEPILVDTVFCGCFRKEIFERIGYFNENLPRGQDMEFNLRLKKVGGKILFVPEIKSFYYARSDLKSSWQHSFMDGKELIYPLKFGIIIFSWRHLIPLVFVLSLIMFGLLAFFSLKFLWPFLFLLGLYLSMNLYFSVKISFAKKNFRYLFLLPIAFSVLHVGYGLGSIYGLLKLLVSKYFWKNFRKYIKSTIKNK